jgi:hypothetical protein
MQATQSALLIDNHTLSHDLERAREEMAQLDNQLRDLR